MRTLPLTNLFFLFLLVTLFYGCEEPDPPVADFNVTQTDSLGNVYVKFFDNSTNSPNKWEWSFEGGFPKTSDEQNPVIVFKEPGRFDVTLIASNEGGSNEIIKYAYVNVARIINNMPADAEVTFNSQTKTLTSRSYVQFLMIDEYQTSCHVETSGKSANGEQIGLLIYWDITADLNEYSFYEFGLGPDVVFFNVTNNSDYTFSHFHANVDDPDYESLEEIVIPNDGKKHGIGYYVANSDMEVRTYFSEGYVIWIEGYSFLMPWNNNQSVDLTFGKSNKTIYEDNLDLTIISSEITNSGINSSKAQDYSNTISNIRFVTPSSFK